MRFLFDTSILIDYLRDPNDSAADALFIAAERGKAFVSLVSLMELYLARDKTDQKIQEEITAVRALCERLGIAIIPSSCASQRRALDVLRAYHVPLGKNALADSVILGIGSARRAYLVTRDKNWFKISDKAISPEDLIRRF